MKATDFLKTRWGELAKTVEGEEKVRKEFQKWLKKTKNSTLAKRARQLWEYLNSGNVSGTEKVLIIAALLYLISPVDLVPDWIPVAGVLDDLGVAAMVLDYVLNRIDADSQGGGSDGHGKKKGKGKSKDKSGTDTPADKLRPIIKAVRKAMKK